MSSVNLSSRESALIGLLAEGRSDADAARELKISRRAVTYALRTLMDRLGVDNRFQLGVALGLVGAAIPAPEGTHPTVQVQR